MSQALCTTQPATLSSAGEIFPSFPQTSRLHLGNDSIQTRLLKSDLWHFAMDPLSILGAVAAASQLFEQGLKITSFLYELYGKAKEAPESIQKQTVKVEQLIDLALLVKENPSLQTEAVASILRTCLRTAEQFQKTLKKVSIADEDGKWKKAGKVASALFKDKEIIQYFDEIEKEKTSLVLCIQEIDS
jgi:hypothetical protein